MKKSLLIAAMAGFALVSCTENDLDNSVKVQEAITFSAPVVKPNTKAASEVGGLYDESLRFRVWGHYYEGNEYTTFSDGMVYIDEAQCTYNSTSNTWIPSKDGNTYYWPKNGTLTFIAYHPSTDVLAAKTSVSNKGLTISNYFVDNAQPNTDMEDLMFSERAYNMKKSSQGDLSDPVLSPYAGVDLQFRHALASIAFNAKQDKAYPGTEVKIKGISLSNVVTEGTFCQNLDDANGETTKTDKLTLGTSATAAAWTWGASATKAKYTVDLTATALDNDADIAAFWPCTNGFVAPALGNFRATDLMLIPQDVSTVKLRIDYSIETVDSDPINQYYEVDLTGSWKIGYRYVYNITFSFDPITFAPTVDVWVDENKAIDNGYMNL